MARPFFTVRYNRYALVLIAVLAISAALDTVFWHYSVRTLENTANSALATARENGWTVDTTPLRSGGWPVGAWVEIDQLNATHHAAPGAPYDAGWAGEHVRLGGSWSSLIHPGLPLSLGGHQAMRLVLNEGIVTALAPGLQIRLKNPRTLTFSVPLLQLSFSGRWPDRQLAAKSVTGRLLRFPEARPGDTRLGVTASATGVSGFPLPYGTSPDLHHGRLAIAMMASRSPAGLSLLDPSSYGRLLLQEASVSPASSDNRISMAGALALPDQTGTLTLTVARWREFATRMLDRPEVEAHLAPDLQAVLQKLLQKTALAPSVKEHPLSISIPVIKGQILPDAQAISVLFSKKTQTP